MEHGPVPPHERSWRHPSEVAADETAELRAVEVPSSTRTFALATGTLGLVAIAVFVLAMTPSRDTAPVALSATTTIGLTVAGGESAPTLAAVRGPVPEAMPARAALATPIGRGDYAVAVLTSVDRTGGDTVWVALPSGRVVTGRIVELDDDTAVIRLSEAEPGHRIAEHRPHDREVVTVLASPPITVAFADIDELSVDEGTAILDVDGELVGLCTRGDHGTEVLAIDEEIEAMGASTDDEPDSVTDDGPETGTGEVIDDATDTTNDVDRAVDDDPHDSTDPHDDAPTVPVDPSDPVESVGADADPDDVLDAIDDEHDDADDD